MTKYVYAFNEVKKGNSQKAIFLLGNKGAQLAEMTSAGLNVPQGFTITTQACNEFYKLNKTWPKGLEEEIKKQIKKLEEITGKVLGGKENPLLVSVRSGSYVSMPGMMDTILNLGLNDETVKGFAQKTNERCAWDSYRRFVQMFGEVVLGIKHYDFEKRIEKLKEEKNVKNDTELNVEDLKLLVKDFKEIVKTNTGKDFPNNVFEQLKLAINAVFNSWNNPRAVSYRKINKLKEDAGTGVNVQVMVFGNMGKNSATGVCFTRNPATGEKEQYGEYLINAQGEDVVAGIRTPKPIQELKNELPEAWKELKKTFEKLEQHYKELQDFEFTIEENKLYLLQTRKGKRTAKAAVKIAVDMVNEGLIDEKEALLRIDANSLDKLLHKQIDQNSKPELLTKGLPASPGAAIGKIIFSAEKAHEMHTINTNEKIILCRTETSPDDIEGMNVSQGILTTRGGMTSHAAVVARGMGIPCIVGCQEIKINEEKKTLEVKGKTLNEGDWISLDGATGEVLKGKAKLVEPTLGGEFATLMKWSDKYKKMQIRTNADIPKDALKAIEFGAEGIGLCRTEHMFFEADRIKTIREMILSKDETGRRKALAKIKPLQKKDFKELFKAMNGKPVTIRFLDPPLHEFLPVVEKDIQEMAKELHVEIQIIKDKVEYLKEVNPMLGHRGVRIGISYPEVYEMQTQAILEAAIEVQEEGIKVLPEIEVPLVGSVNELKLIKEKILKIAKELKVKEKGVEFKIGTMVELPRACMTADEIAPEVNFLSFGTNDLTQTTFGFSRDDIGKFVREYQEKKIFSHDPFQVLDRKGVGKLMKTCVELGRKANSNIEFGICGEHGGEPSSIEFCHIIGLNYVSCSPYRVPIARLAAAQAAIRYNETKKEIQTVKIINK